MASGSGALGACDVRSKGRECGSIASGSRPIAGGWKRMAWRRVLPALVLGPLLFVAASCEIVPTYVVIVGLCAGVASAEIYRLLVLAGHHPAWLLGVPLAIAVAVDGGVTGGRAAPHILIAGAFVALLWAAFRADPRDALVGWALTMTPVLYVGGLLGYFVLIRALPNGAYWVQLVLICTWAGDVGAYYCGRRWGRMKLAPALSPAKSAEGALAGVAGATLVAAIAAAAVPPLGGAPLVVLGLGLAVGLAGVIGDLVESFIKRQLGAKDASQLLLGHGGLLDRLDSLLAAGMVAYYWLVAWTR